MSLYKVVIGANTFSDERILSISNPETPDSQTAEITLANGDNVLTALPLKGLKAVISYENTVGGGYLARPPLWVIDQRFDSWHQGLVCTLICKGKSDLIAEDHASADYRHDATSTKTVKGLIEEILSGTAVSEVLTVSQLLSDATISLYEGNKIFAGQELFLNGRTVTTLSFKLSKVGSPTGDIYFVIRSSFDGTTYQRKILADASALTTTPTLNEITWVTPTEITDTCYLYCEYADGDSSNYVNVSYKNAAVKSGENLFDFINSYVPYAAKDCTYTYKYTSPGIGVFSHCTAHTVTVDTGDTLINVYTPCDGFTIAEGETRDSVVRKLLQFTSSVIRVSGIDENFYIFVPTTSGLGYDGSFTDAQFFHKTKLNGLVIPNYITVHSYPNDVDQYTGAASDATSSALLPIRDSRQMTLVSNTQAASIATAIISQLQVSKGKGSALVPLNNTAQVYDYTSVADTAEGDSLIGNISYIRRIVKANVGRPGKPQLSMEIVCGGVPRGQILASRTPLGKFLSFKEPKRSDEKVTESELDEQITGIYNHLNEIIDHITVLYYGLAEAGIDLSFLKNDTEDRGGINNLIIAQLVNYSTKDYVDGVERIMCIKPIAHDAELTAGDALDIQTIPAYFNGWVLSGVEASVDTVSMAGDITIQIRNVTDGVHMLTTAITIDATERNSSTAVVPAVIDLTHDDVATGDRIAIDIDGAGTKYDAWQATHAYSANAKVSKVASNGFYYNAGGAGTSGGTEPTWPTTINGTVVDNDITWTCVGTYALGLEVKLRWRIEA